MAYKVQEIFEWFSQFNKNDIRIEGETKIFDIELTNKVLPHLLGLHYVNKNYRDTRAFEIYKFIKKENLSDKEILELIKKNNLDKLENVKNRINTIREFLENIEHAHIVEKTNTNSQIKSNYLIIQSKNNMNLHLAIDKTEMGDAIKSFEVIPQKSNYLETYIVQGNNNYFKNSKIHEKIKGIYKYNEKTEEFETFTFKGKEIKRMIEKIEENISKKESPRKEKKLKISKKKKDKEGNER